MPRKKRRRHSIRQKYPAILSNKLYVPAELIEPEDLERFTYEWTERIFDERLDEYGEVMFDNTGKPQMEVQEVEHVITTYNRVYTPFQNYYAFPRGNLDKIEPFLRSFEYEDIRAFPNLPFRLLMKKSTVRDSRWKDQKRCVLAWLDKAYGVIKGTTGSGKTIIGIGLVSRLGWRTIIFTKRKDAYKQWREEFLLHTNLKRLEREMGEQLVGEYTYTRKRAKTYPITVATIQSFKNNEAGRKRLVAIQSEFGLVILDEAHELCTEEYSQPIMFMNATGLVGLTATPERTDHRHKLLYDMVGPIVAENETKQMPPEVTFIKTEECAPPWLYNSRRHYSREYKWTMTLSSLAKSHSRTELILRWMVKDIKEGKYVAAYSERRQIIQKLRDRLAGEGFRVGYVDGNTKNRDEIYDEFRNGELDVLCAGKVLDALVNISELNCLHVCTPVNKESTINQIYGRSRRIKEGKDKTEVRYYRDEDGQLDGAYKNNRRVCNKEGWKIIDDDPLVSSGMKKWVHPSKRK